MKNLTDAQQRILRRLKADLYRIIVECGTSKKSFRDAAIKFGYISTEDEETFSREIEDNICIAFSCFQYAVDIAWIYNTATHGIDFVIPISDFMGIEKPIDEAHEMWTSI